MNRTVWQQRQDRHYRRYTNPTRYPLIVRWGNPRLTSSAKMRTYWGARLLAWLWAVGGRRHIFIEQRGSEQP